MDSLAKKKNLFKVIGYYFLIAILFITSFCCVTVFPALADNGIEFDKTDVVEDLKSDSGFDLNNYPYDKNGKISLISFNEYAYPFYKNMSANFGLYFYIYNPQCLEIDKNSTLHKIEIAFKSTKDEVAQYEKLPLVCLGSSSNPKGIFYKFKVDDKPDVNGDKIYNKIKDKQNRVYDISGIEIFANNTAVTLKDFSASLNAKDYEVAQTYVYTGFSAGYGEDRNAGSTLQCSAHKLETVELSLEHTFWRSQSSSKGAGYQNQIDTVYFSVPGVLFEEYGKLQKIKAEWYEYKTKDIIVTCSENFYNAAKDYVGVSVGAEGKESIQHELLENYTHTLDLAGVQHRKADWGWNVYERKALNGIYSEEVKKNFIDTIYYLLPSDNLGSGNSIGAYDPYNVKTNTAGVSSNALYDYMLSYNKSFNNGYVKDGKISADLFESDIDESRKKIVKDEKGKIIGQIQQGYSFYDFDADIDLISFKSWQDTNPDFWTNLEQYGWKTAIFNKHNIPNDAGTGDTPVSPIITLNEEQLSGTDEEISKRLYVNISDVPTLKEYYTAQSTGGNTVVLFRYALSDYYSHPLDLKYYRSLFDNGVTNNEVYRAKQSVFFDFDVIQLTFNKDGVYKIIPCVASPIDIVNPITQPTFTTGSSAGKTVSWIIIAVIVLIVLFVLNMFFPVFKGLWWLITSPFRLVIWIVKKCKNEE